MNIKRTLVPKKTGGTTTINSGFSSTTNNNSNIDTNNMNVGVLNASDITVSQLNATNATISYLDASEVHTPTAYIGNANIDGDLTTYGNVTHLSSSNNAFDKVFDIRQVVAYLGDHNYFKELIGEANSSITTTNLTTDYLTVTRSAHFFELIIDKIKAAGGTFILSPADGFDIELIEEDTSYYYLYWRACSERSSLDNTHLDETLEDTQEVLTEKITQNMWRAADQAICQTFNLENGAGTYHDAHNTFWWRKVAMVSDSPILKSLDGVNYYFHWIKVYKDNTTSGVYNEVAQYSNNPTVGDSVAMLGNQTDNTRQGAIMLSCYTNWLDNGYVDSQQGINIPQMVAPYFAEYKGINDFNLARHRHNWIATNNTTLQGNIKLGNGTTVEDYVDDKIADIETGEQFYTNLLVFSNQNINVPCSYNGTPLEIDQVEYIYAYHGNTALNIANASFGDLETSYFTLSGIGTRELQVTLLGEYMDSIVDNDSTPIDVTLNAYLSGNQGDTIQYNGTFFMNKTKDGQKGDDGQTPLVYDVVPDVATRQLRYTYDNDGNVTGFTISPSTVTFRIKVTDYSRTTNKIYNATSVPDGMRIYTRYYNHDGGGYTVWSNNTTTFNNNNGYITLEPGASNKYSIECALVIGTQSPLSNPSSVYDTQSVPLIVEGKDGTKGGRYQFMYANYNPSVASTKPTIIPNGSTEYTITQLTSAGWARVPSTPDFVNGEYTYMTQAFFNDGQTSSVWTTPTRITGENGKDGEDGNSIEFVYCHTQSKITNISSFGNVNYQSVDRYGTYAYEPDYQPTTFADNSYWDWTDNPQGVDGISYNYEYMMTREWSKNNTADTDRSYWSVFSTPVIWSSYGEKGMDGDGYEYVFLKHWDSTCPTIYDDDTYTKSGATISKADDDYCPYSTPRGQKVRWNDEPDEPDATGKYVFVSMRKKTNGTWGNFTTGKLWTWYVEDGEPGEEGPQGEQGPAGQNAVKYELVDQDSYANVIMDLDANNNIVSQLDISLKFRVARREGTTVRYMNASEMTGMAVYYRISKSTNSASSYYYYKLNLTTSGDTIAEYSITYTSSNNYVIDANKDVIVALVGSTNSSISDANITNYTMHDTVNLITTLQPNATMQIVQGQQASIKTLVTGQSGLAQQYSTLSETMSGIQTDVVSLTNDVGGLETNMSTIQQTAEGVNSVVKSMYGLKDGVNLNLIKLSTFESISETFGTNTTFKTSSPNNGYWWAQKSGENSSLAFSSFIQNSSISYLGNSSLEVNSYNFNYSGSGSPNADIDYKILNEQINTDSSSQKYCFSIYVKKKNTTGQNRVLLQVSGLSSSGALTDWTNKNNRNDESNVTANSVQVTSGSALYQQFELTDTTWHRLFITFTAGSTTTSPIVGFRIYRNGGDSNPSTSTNYYNIAMPKCEKSAKPTDWTYITDETTLSSQITQTANSISLTVTNDAIDDFSNQLDSGLRQTGISITDGLIELNSDNTVINGNLSIHNANEGLVIYDKNDATVPRVSITNGSIGTIGDDSFINSTINSKAGPNSFNRPQNAGSTTIYLTGSKAMALGTYNNNKLTLDSFSGQITSSVRSEVSSITANLNISTDINSYMGTNVYNGNCTVDSSTNHFNTYTGLTSPTSYLTGTYYLVGTLTVTFSIDNALSSTNRNLITTIRGTRETNASQKIQTIGADGAVFKQTEQRYSWFGTDQQRLRYDNNILEVNTNGICANQQVRFTTSASTTPYITTTMGSNNCFKSRIYGNNAGNVTLDPYDTIITTTQVGITVTLPTCAIGKEYYIWNNSSGNITISPASVTLAAGKTVHLMQFPELRSGGSQPTGNWKVISMT